MKSEKSDLTRRSFIKGGAVWVGSMALIHQTPSLAAGSKTPIKIGHQCDLTGALASTGYWRKKAVDAAAKWLNAQGGIAGRPIQIVTVDTETKVDVGVRRMHQLIENDKVDFVIGSEHGGIAFASNSVAKELKVLYLSMSRTDVVTGKGLNPYVFRIQTDTSLAAKASAGAMVKKIGKRWSILYADYAWGLSNKNAWARWVEALGGTVTQSQSMAVNTADPLPYVSRLDPSVDGIYVALLGPDVLRGLSALRQMGFAAKQILTADAVFAVADTLSLGKQVEGIWGGASAPFELADKDTPYLRAMRKAVGIDKHGREVGTRRACTIGDIWPAWENFGLLKKSIEGSGWKARDDNLALIKHIEANPNYPESEFFPQGDLYIRPADHQGFCDYYGLRVKNGEIRVESRIPKEEGMYPATVNIASK